MTALWILFGIIAAAALVIWGVDFYHYLLNRYCRYHIGRWPDTQAWQQAVIHRAIRWTVKTPTVKITDNNRYLLLDMLQGRHRSNTIQSWQTASLLLGLEHIGTSQCKEAVQKAIAKLLDKQGMFRVKPTNVDCGMLAYSLLKSSDAEQIRPAMDFAAQLILSRVAEDGTLVYVNDVESDERYVDTVGLACPFLACYGKTYGKPEYTALAVKQLRAFSEYGLEESTSLPNHAYSASSKLPLGVYGWGRGTGWYALGLIDTYKELPDGEDKQWLKEQLRKVADSYLNFQHADGGFGYIMQMQKGYDSSATAALAYFYRECSAVFGKKTYAETAALCLDKLRSVTRITGAIDWCQGDTKGIGIFAQTYDIMPFAQGLALRAISFEQDRD